MKFMKGCFTVIGGLVVAVLVLGFFAALGNQGRSSATTSEGERAAVPTFTPTGVTLAANAAPAPTLEPTVAPTPAVVFTRDNWAHLASNPNGSNGAHVDIVGKVFGQVERDDKATFWQMWSDPRENEWNTVVTLRDPGFQLKDGDYVHVIGTVEGEYSGENAFGARIAAVMVIADSAVVVDGLAAASPAIRTVDTNLEINQHNLIVRVARVEYAVDETRVHVLVVNGTPNTAYVYDFNTKAVQGSTQFETEYNSSYPELQSDLLPNIESQGIIVFPPMNPATATTLYIEGRSDDYSLDFVPYTFEVPAQ